ncbi:MAG: inorganic phosphate transporter [Chloroflexota bacterium]
MPEPSLGLFVAVVVLALGFAVTNGLNDAANAIATVVGTRVLTPAAAVLMAAVCNFGGALTGTAVARTVGQGLLMPGSFGQQTLIAALAAIVMWGLATSYYGFPISLTHGLISGMAGAGLATAGVTGVQWGSFAKIGLAIVIAPVLGFAAGYLVMMLLLWVLRSMSTSRVRSIFSNLQIVSAAFMAFSHGRNDGQLPIGVITAGLVVYTGSLAIWDSIPLWVMLISATAITLGTALGGWQVIKTLGARVTTLRPINGFAAEASAATVIQVAATVGIPVSTTHCISAAIMGVGASKRFSAVRWRVATDIIFVWVTTIPACALLGWVLAWVAKLFFV